MEPVVTRHIESTPGTCGGKPRVSGTRIRVQDIVLWTEQGRSPDEIVNDYPQLTLSDVHAALAYYHDNQQRIEADIRAGDDLVDRMMADAKLCEPQSSSSGKDADGNSVSS
ncbi:MAG: DUF433 domain-containing protein [Pirellulales bacterium]